MMAICIQVINLTLCQNSADSTIVDGMAVVLTLNPTNIVTIFREMSYNFMLIVLAKARYFQGISIIYIIFDAYNSITSNTQTCQKRDDAKVGKNVHIYSNLRIPTDGKLFFI